ncbi:GNAT family N-acetyltransferase [Paenibacillus sp. strain BS8-2]
MQELKAERLRLRMADETRAVQVLEYFVRNQAFLTEWEVKRDRSYYTIEAQEMLLRQDMDLMAAGLQYKFWMYKHDDPNRIIGSVTLSNIVKGAFLNSTLGYRLDEQERNQGYMTEALKVLIQFAFEGLGLHRIEANIMPRNVVSRRVVEKLGFRNEGLAIRYLRINGKWEDHIHMVLLNEALE